MTDQHCEAPVCTELEIYNNNYSRRMMVKDVEICKNGQAYISA